VQVNPAGDTADVRGTAPEKPLTPVTVIVETAALPWTTVTLAGLAARVKLVTITAALPELAA